MKTNNKTYEGIMIIKWNKNDNGDCRPLTIYCQDKIQLNKELKRIKELFMTEGDCSTYPIAKPYNISTPAFSVKFDLTQRK